MADDGFTPAERKAMQDRAAELRAQGTKGAKAADAAQAVLDAIAAMPDDDRAIAERVHAVVHDVAPHLQPKTWYGMPAYANGDGKVVVFFQAASKFDARYATVGFDQAAQLDDGTMWPASFAILEMSAANERAVADLVRRAAPAPSQR